LVYTLAEMTDSPNRTNGSHGVGHAASPKTASRKPVM
jgi:hypothetical protein